MEITVYYTCLIATIDYEETFEFIGLGNTLEESKVRAQCKMKEDEYLKCVRYNLIGAHYGIL